MPEATQRVVVIQDASRDINSSAIKWAIDGLSLKPGDELTLLGVLHQFNNPSTFPFTGAGKIMGYKSLVDSRSMLGANQRIISQEVRRKEEEYEKSTDILQLSEFCEMSKITLNKKVVAAPSPNEAVLEAAKDLKATWIILDRLMKKDKKIFMDALSCGIARVKRNNAIEILRGPKTTNKYAERADGSTRIKYNDISSVPNMISGLKAIRGYHDEDLFSLEFSPLKSRRYPGNSSNEELTIDSKKNLPATSNLIPSSPTLGLTENQSLRSTDSTSVQTKQERSSIRISENECFPLQRQEESTSTQIAAADNYSVIDVPINFQMQSIETDETSKGELKNANMAGAIRHETANEHLECLNCANEQPRLEVKREFTYAELHAATNGFSTENFLSEGGFGYVYKGKLKDGHQIAVKQYKHESLQGENEFTSEVNVLSKTRHKNVVMLIGSCSEGSHRLIVYEYICNGSLDIHLSKNRPEVLSWRYRMNIALGVARGLNYLHQNNVIHRDTRPNNILVTHDYEPLLGDFGLAITQYGEFELLLERKVVGTIGYLAPEYAERGSLSTKMDVYSFGVVLLELITGRTTGDKTLQEKGLAGWARPLLKEKKYPELIDERILDCHDVHQLFWMVRVAEICLRKDPDKRPSMEQVEYALECVMSGETVTGIEDFSPTRFSDDRSSKSTEPQTEIQTDAQERTSASSFSTSQASGSFSASFSSQSSRSMGTFSSFKGSSSSDERTSFQKKREKSQIHVLYDEMLS